MPIDPQQCANALATPRPELRQYCRHDRVIHGIPGLHLICAAFYLPAHSTAQPNEWLQDPNDRKPARSKNQSPHDRDR